MFLEIWMIFVDDYYMKNISLETFEPGISGFSGISGLSGRIWLAAPTNLYNGPSGLSLWLPSDDLQT